MSGLAQDDLASWLEHDEVTASLNAYADPFVLVDVERVDYEGKSFIAIRVHEYLAGLFLCTEWRATPAGVNHAIT